MDVFAIHAAGLKALENEQGASCPQLYWNGALIDVLPGGARLKRENSAGGFSLDSDLKLTCLAADFPALPQSQDEFNYPGQNGKLYRIVSVTTAGNGYQLHIEANDANQGL